MLSFRGFGHSATKAARHFSNSSISISNLSSETVVPLQEPTEQVGGTASGDVPVGCQRKGGGNLERRLSRLKFPKQNAVVVIRKWIEEGHKVHKHRLIDIVRKLRRQKLFKQALEICEWMRVHGDFKLLPGEYAIHLDLISKVCGLSSAEKFFEDLPDQMKKVPSTWNSLLHVYVQHNLVSKAESLMEDLFARGLITCCIPYNHMVNLYITNGQLDKVPKVIEELKKNTLPNVVTYNLWLTACAEDGSVDAVKSAEKVFVDMEQRRIPADWMTYTILTNIYMKQGMVNRAKKILMDVENLGLISSVKDRKAFCSVITLWASLSDKDSVIRIWNQLKSTFPKMNDDEYSCVLASLIKTNDIKAAEAIYSEWETVSATRKIKVSNIMLSGYTQNGSMNEAEMFHDNAVKKGSNPNYITWELLAWGYLSQENKLGEVLNCLKEAFAALKKWKVDEKIIKAVFDKIELGGEIELAEKFLVMLRKAGYVTTWIYNSLIRTYAKGGKMPLIVLERMKKDRVEPDEETKELLISTSRLPVSSNGSPFV